MTKKGNFIGDLENFRPKIQHEHLFSIAFPFLYGKTFLDSISYKIPLVTPGMREYLLVNPPAE